MNNKQLKLFPLVVVFFIAGVFDINALTSDSENQNSNVELTDDSNFRSYGEAGLTDQTNVLFFAADWCNTCQRAKNNFLASLDDFPEDLYIFEVDFDDEDALRRKYGVSIQHTFVQVDQNGNELNQWQLSNNIDDVLENII